MNAEEIVPAIQRAFAMSKGGSDQRRRILKCLKYLERERDKFSSEALRGACEDLRKLAGDRCVFAKKEQEKVYKMILERLDNLDPATRDRRASRHPLDTGCWNGA